MTSLDENRRTLRRWVLLANERAEITMTELAEMMGTELAQLSRSLGAGPEHFSTQRVLRITNKVWVRTFLGCMHEHFEVEETTEEIQAARAQLCASVSRQVARQAKLEAAALVRRRMAQAFAPERRRRAS